MSWAAQAGLCITQRGDIASPQASGLSPQLCLPPVPFLSMEAAISTVGATLCFTACPFSNDNEFRVWRMGNNTDEQEEKRMTVRGHCVSDSHRGHCIPAPGVTLLPSSFWFKKKKKYISSLEPKDDSNFCSSPYQVCQDHRHILLGWIYAMQRLTQAFVHVC